MCFLIIIPSDLHACIHARYGLVRLLFGFTFSYSSASFSYWILLLLRYVFTLKILFNSFNGKGRYTEKNMWCYQK